KPRPESAIASSATGVSTTWGRVAVQYRGRVIRTSASTYPSTTHAFTTASQSEGIGTGQPYRWPSTHRLFLRHKLDQRQSSARSTSPACNALRSTYRHAVRKCASVVIGTDL